MYFWIFPVAVLGSSFTKVTLCGALKREFCPNSTEFSISLVADSVYPTKLFASEILFSMYLMVVAGVTLSGLNAARPGWQLRPCVADAHC